MKKFSQRSRRGQRRLLIFIGMLLFALLLVTLYVLDTGLFSEMGLGQESAEGDSDVSSDNAMVTPSLTPAESADVASLEWLYNLVLNPVNSYGSEYNGVPLKQYFLDKALGDSTLPTNVTTIEYVGLGDIAVCGSDVGICVGQYDGVLLFAYISSLTSDILPNGGIYLGYSAEQRDATLYGMLPVPFERYYDVSTAKCSDLDLRLIEKLLVAAAKMQWYENLVYYYGRQMSDCCVDELIDVFPKNLLAATHLAVDRSEFLAFLEQFSTYAESSFLDYSFKVIDEVAFDEYSIFTVNCISMAPDSLFESSGAWKISIYRTGEFVPCIAPQIEKYIGLCGFVLEGNSVPVLERTDEELAQDKEMSDAGFVLQSDGTYIYHGEGYSIVIDPDDFNTHKDEEDLSEELVYDGEIVSEIELTEEEIDSIVDEAIDNNSD